jgi:hypothetical protein
MTLLSSAGTRTEKLPEKDETKRSFDRDNKLGKNGNFSFFEFFVTTV